MRVLARVTCEYNVNDHRVRIEGVGQVRLPSWVVCLRLPRWDVGVISNPNTPRELIYELLIYYKFLVLPKINHDGLHFSFQERSLLQADLDEKAESSNDTALIYKVMRRP